MTHSPRLRQGPRGFTLIECWSSSAFRVVTDGRSGTVACGESTKGSGTDATGGSLPTPRTQDLQGLTGNPMTDAFCGGIATYDGRRGREWSRGSFPFATFDHHLAPNGRTMDCLSGNFAGRFAPRSYHPGGVDALFLDGHVQFVKDPVSVATWRSLATIGGGEVVSADRF